MNVVPCVEWVKRGGAAALPDKVLLTVNELEAIISQTECELRRLNGDPDDGEETSENNVEPVVRACGSRTDADGMAFDEYNFENYDNEAGDVHYNIGGLAVYTPDGKDPYVTIADSEDEDSEKEDDAIKPDDNLVLVGRVEGDANILEIFVYNEKEGSFYCHHDILLHSFPLCLEWLSFDPAVAKPGNFCAIGNMTKVIDIWDLDLVNSVQPLFTLGKNKADKGHKDAVLDLSWNTNYSHVLASGSVDKSTMLWDMEIQKRETKLSSFTDRVQSIQFHPTESHHLLTGCADSVVRLFDCKVENESKNWTVSGEVERVLWNHFDPNYCFVSTSNGFIECIDVRQEKILWQVSAHEKEITGLSLSASCPGLLVTASSDRLIKVWDVIKPEILEPVWEKKMNLGGLQCLAQSPDSPFVFAVGGDNKANNFKVWDILESSSVSDRFKDRKLVQELKSNRTDVMEVADNMEALEAGTSSKIKKNRKNWFRQ